MRARILLVLATVAACLGVTAPAPAATGCMVAEDPAGDASSSALDLTGATVSTVAHDGNTYLRAVISVRSLPSVPPNGASWEISFKNNANRWPGVYSNPYFRMDVNAITGTVTAQHGYIQNGVHIPWSLPASQLIPGTPGQIVAETDLSTLSIAPDNSITDFVTTTATQGLGSATAVDSSVRDVTAYRVGAGFTSCLDPVMPAQPAALPADAFVDSIGVNIHLNYAGYQDYGVRMNTYAQIENTLADLGLRYVRELWSGTPAVKDELIRLASQGVRTDIVFDDEPPMATMQQVSDYLHDVGAGVASVEGPNEPMPVDWAPIRAFQQNLYTTIKSDPDLAHIPVLSPSINLSRPNEYALLGDVSDYADYGAIHDYAMTEPYTKTQVLDVFRDLQSLVTGNKPVQVTEAGWNNFASGWYAGPAPSVPKIDWCNTCVSERAAASYIPKLLLVNLAAGVSRTYIYELLDEAALTAPTGSDFFGLVRTDFSPKPAYTPLKNLIALLEDPGPSFTPASLTHSISDPQVQHLLLQKRDGTFWLALWQDARLFTPEPLGGERIGPGDLSPPSRTTTVTLPSPVSATEYRPGRSTSPVTVHPLSTSVSVSVPSDDVVLLKL